MTALRRGWRAVGNRLVDPLEDALRLARKGWDRRTAADRAAPPDRTFPLHLIRAAISWVTRLALDRDANRAITRTVRRLGKLSVRWPKRATSLSAQYKAEHEHQGRLTEYREAHGEAIRRSAIALILAMAASVFLTVVDLSIGEGGIEMVLTDPAKAILGVKLKSLAGWGFVLLVAAAIKLSASALRRIFSGDERRANVVKVAVCATLVFGFVVAFAGPRQDAAQSGSGATQSGAKTPGNNLERYSAPTDGTEDFPWYLLLLGVAPYVVGTVLLAFAQSTAAETDTRLLAVHRWSSWRRRRSERQFGRVQVAVDRAERRFVDVYLGLRRAVGEEEAARIVHAVGYRLVDGWGGYLAALPELLKRIEDSRPGGMPSFDEDYLTRVVATPERVVDGGPIRQRLEDLYGNPLAERAQEVHAQSAVASRASQNGTGSRRPAIKKAKRK